MNQFQTDTGLCSGVLPPLATGTSEFVQLRPNREAYVDKTAETRLLAYPSHYLFLSRLRWFGRTLMLTTIECMYQGHLPVPGQPQVACDIFLPALPRAGANPRTTFRIWSFSWKCPRRLQVVSPSVAVHSAVHHRFLSVSGSPPDPHTTRIQPSWCTGSIARSVSIGQPIACEPLSCT